jgi:hypothetical protein
VVKRAAQAGQKRRLRMAAPSSVGRESFTCVSSLLQNGHRMIFRLSRSRVRQS